MFIPLFNKSNYSLLSSLLKIDDIINYAKTNNISSISLTDTNMYGVMEFIKKCQANEIKPIIGLNVLLNDYNIILLAKNYDGYKSLIKLSTIQNEKQVTETEILEHNNERICVLPFKYNERYTDLTKIYSDIYLGYENKKEELEALVITKNVIFLREALYLTKADSKFLPYLYRIRDGKTISEEINYDIENHELSIDNILDLTDNQGLVNTLKVADACNLEFPPSENLLPIYECDNPTTYLFELCKVGLTKRCQGNIPPEYKERLAYELKVINEMGFANYFLVVYDYIKYAKKNGILVGPGRGSAAGSLVSYSLGITDVDPIKYDLLFERFLNPERITMPDIDIDFEDERREEVVEYVREKYGSSRVAKIIAFGTMAAKDVLRTVAKINNVDDLTINSLLKMISSKKSLKLGLFYLILKTDSYICMILRIL